MALIVETGSGSSTSESYASVADADTFFANRGFSLWTTMSTAEKEQALRRATDYMLQSYRGRWEGSRATTTQAQDWPRYFVQRRDILSAYVRAPVYYPFNIVPDEVKSACIALAYKAAAGDLAPDIEPQTISESVGPISVSYASGSRQTVRYQAIDMLLSPFLTDGGSGSMARIGRS